MKDPSLLAAVRDSLKEYYPEIQCLKLFDFIRPKNVLMKNNFVTLRKLKMSIPDIEDLMLHENYKLNNRNIPSLDLLKKGKAAFYLTDKFNR